MSTLTEGNQLLILYTEMEHRHDELLRLKQIVVKIVNLQIKKLNVPLDLFEYLKNQYNKCLNKFPYDKIKNNVSKQHKIEYLVAGGQYTNSKFFNIVSWGTVIITIGLTLAFAVTLFLSWRV